MKLKLGEEEFNATGASIKKAQHAVATEALLHTRCARPVKKQTNKSWLPVSYLACVVWNDQGGVEYGGRLCHSDNNFLFVLYLACKQLHTSFL